jgi:hypothetical protein
MTRSRDVASGIIIGTTANRPTGFQGQLYFDTTLDNLYQKNSTQWQVAGTVPGLPVDILVIAGGGGGGRYFGGGGGAGGLLGFSQNLVFGATPTITVGAGGPGNSNQTITNPMPGTVGFDSQFGSLTLVKGGGAGGGGFNNGSTGGNGGSGGGAGGNTPSSTLSGGSFVSGQGNAGGSSFQAGGGGGGGADAAGSNNVSSGNAGPGGAGSSVYSSWGLATSTGQNVSGTVFYAGGGGGSGANGPAGGSGGGGRGASDTVTSIAGTANTGGGGGGGSFASATNFFGQNGGSGVVIMRYADTSPDLASIAVGLTYTRTVTGGYKYYTFTAGTGVVTI